MESMKAFLTFSALLLFTTSAFAVVPGEGPDFERSYNDSVVNVSTEESELFNTSVNGSNVSVDVVGLETKGSYSFDVNLSNSSANDSFYMENFSLTVDEYNNFSLRPENISENVSIGSSGELEKISIEGRGNSVEEVNLGLTGNISSFVTLLDDDKFIPVKGTRPVNLVYDVARSQGFGQYNGSLVVNGSDRSRNLSIDLSLVDEIRPQFESNNVSDFMATNPQVFMVQVSDNLKVSNVSVEIVREYREIVNETTNETKVVNSTVSNGSLDRMSGDDSKWTYRFSDVDEIDDYYAVFEVSDESKNTNNLTVPFDINGLDSVSVLDGDFEFEDSRPRTDDNPSRQVVKEVFTKSSDKDLDLYLSDVETDNKSLFIGVKNEEMSNPKALYEDNESQNVSLTDSGRYSLVVYSDSAGFSYDGVLNLDPVSQHVEFDRTIRFSGAFVDPEYPPLPDERSLGSFSGSMEFVLNDNGVPEGLTYEGEQLDISDCKGADSWSNCLPGYTLGEIPEYKQARENAVFERNIAIIFLATSGLFVIFMMLNNYATGTAVKAKEVPKTLVGTVVERDQTIEEVMD